ncbi:DUF4124 domain-containing protein [Iodobacter fluviatilis]|uniref:Uncharacterized protein DUF4124 n=1 Tax=Iodobacter fluviatilis TaxID=537 RepID=A0A377Q8W2_9NEIS|nr:DUF4124 domain-containing protein [Iodobacter fluviatilis]TCU86959.1 uncharacterized protein DUF4124 [Iodobacter fluviatilis]STQ90291.1 Uncharacterised protein [Iodobacter fluviatilis]
MKILLLASLLAMPAFAAKVYQWRDADGRVFYSDQPAPGQNARERNIRVPSNTASPSQDQPVMVLYVSPECGQPCSDAVEMLDSRKINYELKNPSRSEPQMIEFINLVGSLSVRTPVLVMGKKVLSPWDKLIWSATLNKAGYPAQEKKNASQAK